MGRFTNTTTGVTFSVNDSKDGRYDGDGYKAASDAAPTKYDGLTAAVLKDEIEKRNVDRKDDDQISTKGNKPDLVKALVADDEAQA